jgi:homoserine dehydrogenase
MLSPYCEFYLEIRTLIVGFGRVSQAFVSTLIRQKPYLFRRYGIEISLIGAVEGGKPTFHSAYSEDGLDLELLLSTKRQQGRISSYPRAGGHLSSRELIRESGAQLLIEATPTNLTDGEPGLTHIRTAISAGMHIVTSNKGPLVVSLNELRRFAQQKTVELMYSAAVAGELPVMPIGSCGLAGSAIRRIEGILNATTNFVLTQMHKRELDMMNALDEAKRLGIAERDPNLDIEGFDTAAKLLIATNSLMEANIKLSEVDVSGIRFVTPNLISEAKQKGCVLKLVGSAHRHETAIKIKVAVEEIPRIDPFYFVDETGKAVRIHTDLFGETTLMSSSSGPRFTAASILRDLINICGSSSSLSH